jgi:DNA-binding LacI/PurR family transcriptional regulator/signal transduction histidine kinase
LADNQKFITLFLPTMMFSVDQELYAGARDYLAQHDYHLLTAIGGYLPAENKPSYIRNWIYPYLSNHQTDGILFYSGGIGYTAEQESVEQLLSQFTEHPLVNLGMPLKSLPSVLVDNRIGFVELVKYLIEDRGFRRFGFFGGPITNNDSEERYQALVTTLANYDLHLKSDWILQGDFTRSLARLETSNWLSNLAELPEVMVCANDLSALGFIEAIKEHGLRVPEDIAVTGCDNVYYADAVDPALTSVIYPAYEMGVAAAKSLLDKIQGNPFSANQHIGSTAVIRESCGNSNTHQHFSYTAYREERRNHLLIREMNAHRLAFEQRLFEKTDLLHLFEQAAGSLQLAGIHQLYLCLFDSSDTAYSRPKLQYQVINGNLIPLTEAEKVIPPTKFLPEKIGQPWLQVQSHTLWLVHPLAFENEVFGYLLAEVNKLVSEFGEALGIQLSQAINRQRMLLQSIERQYELECSLEALKNAHLKLDKAEKVASMGRLIAGIGHELNTPLGAGVTMASMLVDEAQSLNNQLASQKLTKSNLQQALERSNNAAQSLLKSLQRAASLVDIFKSNSFEQESYRWPTLTLWEVINSSYLRIKEDLALELELAIDCDKSLMTKFDIEALSSIFVHLLYNSAHHAYLGHEHGKVVISVTTKKEKLVIKYQDFGLGIEKDSIPRLFEPFFTTGRNRGHTGLGLYLVYNLVSLRLHGVITVSSKSKKGTQFIIELPLPNESNKTIGSENIAT